MAGYDIVDVSDLDGEGPSGMVRKARRAVGAKAFGFNYFVFPPNQEGLEHDHVDSNQEEVYFVVKGSGTMRIDGEEIELRPGRFVRVDPGATRVLVSGAAVQEMSRRAFLAKLEAEVDPAGVLPPEERARRVEHKRQAHMKRMALASSRASSSPRSPSRCCAAREARASGRDRSGRSCRRTRSRATSR